MNGSECSEDCRANQMSTWIMAVTIAHYTAGTCLIAGNCAANYDGFGSPAHVFILQGRDSVLIPRALDVMQQYMDLGNCNTNLGLFVYI